MPVIAPPIVQGSYPVPSVSDFKAQFPRDFPYAVPAWGAAGSLTLAGGVITVATLTAGGMGYRNAPVVLVDDVSGSGALITASVLNGLVSGLSVVQGGLNYSAPRLVFMGGAGDDSDLSRVTDTDIMGGIFDASFNVTQTLFDDEGTWARAFLYLAAHMMVEKLLMAGEGLASQYNWLTQSKTVGNVNESFLIPDKIMKDPLLAAISKTRYGAMYIAIISPLLVAGFFSTHRRTQP